MGLLDLTGIHQAAFQALLVADGSSKEVVYLRTKAGGRFLDEALSPFEISRLSGKGANTALRRLYDVLEEEAKRIAHILHDESAQLLATAYLELAHIARNSPEPIAAHVGLVIRHLDEVREQLRRLSHELRPLILDQLGLLPALDFLAKGFTKRFGLKISINGDTDGRKSQAVETVLYRTVQEALTNISRHANATETRIKVWVEKNVIYCTVTDNGSGFEILADDARNFRGLGLIGIRERVSALQGEFEIDSSPGAGTKLQVVIPL
jgi:signal transduction histidine kinase